MLTETYPDKTMINWNFEDSKAENIHSIHPYPAKFIPEIPRALLHTLEIPKNSIVLDPFCGSGVTLVESQKLGIESVGVDLNPIACLISRVKTQSLNVDFLACTHEIVERCRQHRGKIIIPQIPNLDHWFKLDIQKGLSILLNEINKQTDANLVDALKFCLSSIIVKVSNQESDTRYAAINNVWEKDDVFNFFKSAAEKLAKAKSNNSTVLSKVLNKNSLEISETDFNKKVGLVITSPPYPNAYEYWLYHKYRMWWLGYDPIEVKSNEIGARAHYFKKNHQTIDDFITQMDTLFTRLYKVCCTNAYVCFVIGNSKIHGEIIENEKLIIQAGQKAGLKHIQTINREIRSNRKSFNLSHARIKEEYIVILQKQKI